MSGDEVDEAVLLSTCNRIEVIVSTRNNEAARMRLRSFFRRELAAGDAGSHRSRHGDDLLLAAVGQGQAQGHRAVARRVGHQSLERLARSGREEIDLADGRQADVVVHDLVALFEHVAVQQLHQGVDLDAGTLPVLLAERVECEGGDAESSRGTHRRAHCVGPALVPRGTRLTARLGPTTIAVHNNSDVLGDTVLINGFIGFLSFISISNFEFRSLAIV